MVALVAALAAALFVLGLAPDAALAADDGEKFQEAWAQGLLPAALSSLWIGFLTSLTPCVYPMIAITVSVFGAKQAKSRSQAVLLSTAFLAGLVTLSTLLFVVASLTGSMASAVLQNKYFIIGLALFFCVMAASMFGAFELTLPDSVMQRLSAVGGVGYKGAFIMGLVTAPIAAPCSGPGLLTMMGVVTEAQSIPLGIVFGVSYALGLGALFWVVGTFAVGLPKGGRWMVWVKSFFGVAMLVMALYYLKNAFPGIADIAKNDNKFLLIMAGIGLAGLLIGAVHIQWDDGGVVPKIRKVLGVATTVVAAFLFVAALEKPKELTAEEMAAIQKEAEDAAKAKGEVGPVRLLEWGHDEMAAVQQAKTEKRPLIVDFTADWCGACKELAKHTFANPEVMKKGGRFVAVKVDATDDEDPKVEALLAKYGIRGAALPAVIVFDSEGKEQKRINEFIPAEDFLAIIEKVN